MVFIIYKAPHLATTTSYQAYTISSIAAYGVDVFAITFSQIYYMLNC